MGIDQTKFGEKMEGGGEGDSLSGGKVKSV